MQSRVSADLGSDTELRSDSTSLRTSLFRLRSTHLQAPSSKLGRLSCLLTPALQMQHYRRQSCMRCAG